jgi:acyl-CoA reductase-like NAD-dependent aldehyde dehydrogenase
VNSSNNKEFSVINPATEQELCKVSEASDSDVNDAVTAARQAFENNWRHSNPSNRSRLLHKLADLIERDIEVISDIECLDNGKPREMIRQVDIPLVIKCIRYYAGWCDKLLGNTIF